MHGTTDPQTTLVSSVTPDSMIPPDHPIRRIKKLPGMTAGMRATRAAAPNAT